jgi:hypothetical protein
MNKTLRSLNYLYGIAKGLITKTLSTKQFRIIIFFKVSSTTLSFNHYHPNEHFCHETVVKAASREIYCEFCSISFHEVSRDVLSMHRTWMHFVAARGTRSNHFKHVGCAYQQFININRISQSTISRIITN